MLKDWKRDTNFESVIVYINKNSGAELNLSRKIVRIGNNRLTVEDWGVELGSKLLKECKTKAEAIKYAKNYMRKN